MYWKNVPDEFVFEFKPNKIPKDLLDQIRSPTRREVLSIVMSIIDPFGYLANIHVYAKIFLQSLWSMPLGWDDQLLDNVAERWYAWESKMENISNISIRRCYWSRVHENVVDVALIYGKARVGPRKLLSIPRMELQVGVLGTTMKESVLKYHTIVPSEIYFWSDLKILLQ